MSEIVSPYNLKTDKFEGPLELLLSLIEDRKFFVNEISLASVTDDYLKYIKGLSEVDNDEKINNISSFVLTAATLILVKSRSLLPNISLTEDEKENINDLELRLKLYEIIKRASLDIKNDFGKKIIFKPEDRIWSLPVFSPDPLINKNNIAKIIDEVINQLPKPKEPMPELEIKKVVKIEEVIDSLTNRIQNALNLSFKEFSQGAKAETKEEAKVNVIISFLAMLELVREGIIDVVQNSSFEDIAISKTKAEALN